MTRADVPTLLLAAAWAFTWGPILIVLALRDTPTKKEN